MNLFFNLTTYFILWYIFSGINQLFLIFSGIGCSLLLTLIGLKQKFTWQILSQFKLKLGINYLFFMCKEVITSTIEVIKKSITLNYESGFITANCTKNKILVAESITLTPGTITVETYDSQFIIHALNKNEALTGINNIIKQKFNQDVT
jgi:multicomponent Na+:H+ antiporter subunit E